MAEMISRVRRSSAALVAALVVSGILAAPTTYAQQQRSVAVPVTGVIDGVLSFVGTFTLNRFAVVGGELVAVGTVTGTVTNLVTGAVTSIVQNVVVPVEVGQTTCQILHLDIGPIFLDLLGLQVQLSEVVLDITAVAGAGNLLGNLLCAVAGLLDNPTGLAKLLNDILAAL
jgi:hypothetical protein